MAEVLLTLKVDAQGNAEIVKTGEAMGQLEGKAASAKGALGALPPQMAMVAGAAAALFAAITSVTVVTSAAIVQTGKYGSAIADLSAKTQTSIRELQVYRLAAADVGVANEAIAKGLSKLQNEVVKGNGAFKQLGLDVQKLREMSPERMFEAVGQSIAKIKNPAEQTAAAIALFGRSGAELLPVLTQNLGAARAEAERLGMVLSDKAVKSADAFDDATTKLGLAWEALIHQFGAAALEGGGLTAVVNMLIDRVAALTQWVIAHKDQISEFFEGGAKAAMGLINVADRVAAAVGKIVTAFNSMPGWVKALALGPSVGAGSAIVKSLQGEAGDPLRNIGKAGTAAAAAGAAPTAGGFDPNADERAKAAAAAAAKHQKELEKDALTRAKNLLELRGGNKVDPMPLLGTTRDTFEVKREFARLDEAKRILAEANQKTGGPKPIMPGLVHDGTVKPIEQVKRELEHAAKHSRDWAQELQNVANVARFLPPIFGQVLGSIAGAATAMKGMNFKNAAGGFSLTGGTGLGGLLGNVSGGLQIAGLGIQLGKQVFDSLTESGPEKVMREVGRDWGVQIDEGLAEQINKDAKGRGRGDAALLHFTEIMKQAGGVQAFGADKAAAGMHDLFSAVERGTLTMKEAGKVFDENFGEVAAAHVSKTTGIASAQLLELVDLAKRFGMESPALQEFMRGQARSSAGNIQAGLGGAKLASANAAGAAGGALAGDFAAMLEGGMSRGDALQAMGPAVADLRKQLEETGFAGGAAFDALAQQIDIVSNKITGPLITSTAGWASAAVNMFNMGQLNQDMLMGFTEQISANITALEEQGVVGPAAIQALQPDLQKIWELQQKTHFEVDATTQSMIDSAVASGQIGEQHRSAADKMLEASERTAEAVEFLAEKFGYLASQADRAMHDRSMTVTTNFQTTGGGGVPPGGFVPPPDQLPQFAEGVFRGDFPMSGAAVAVHGRESIVPQEDEEAFAHRVLGHRGGGGGGNVTVNFSPNITTSADPNEVADKIAEAWDNHLLPKLTTAAERALGGG